ncbi:MAG TPA: PAS domain-containing protein [Gammaproteobacteria bacterium]
MSAIHPMGSAALDPEKLIANLPGFIYVCDYDESWTMRYLSESAETILGYPTKDLIDNRLIAYADLIHPDDQASILVSAEKNLAERKPCEYEYRVRTASGSEIWVWERSHGLYDESGNVLRIEGYVEDISRRSELQREITVISERERTRIGADLHDGLGQELTGISLSLETLAESLARKDSEHAQAARALREMVQAAISHIRHISRMLSPGLSDELRLSQALEVLAEEINEASNTACHAHCTDEERQPDLETSTHLYRLAQEAVSNALRHSGARNIEIRYQCDDALISLEVLDDGVGFSLGPDVVEGIGLRSMRYRAEAIGADLEIVRRSEGGTQVRCSRPFDHI